MICAMCGGAYGSCNRPCINNPHKHNPLLFHSDGRPKTLQERGLGLRPGEIADRLAAMEKAKREGVPYDYRPFEAQAKAWARDLISGRPVNKRVNIPVNKSVNAPDVNKDEKRKKARENMAEYMRQYRAKKHKD